MSVITNGILFLSELHLDAILSVLGGCCGVARVFWVVVVVLLGCSG